MTPSPESSGPRHVAVVGGGLAGLTAACALADAGLEVTLLEARSRLGGATFSLRRELSDGGTLTVDNGQHVVLRCYTRYIALLQRLGTAARIRFQPRLRIPVRRPGGRPALLQPGPLPAPAHLAWAIARYRLLSPADRWAALRAADALVRLDPADPSLDARSFGDWLTDHGQSGRSRQALWDLLSVAALNARPDEASLALVAKVFHTAFGARRSDAADLGVPDVPLRQLHVDPAETYLRARGGRVLVKAPVHGLQRRDEGWIVRRGGQEPAGTELRCDGVVLAVPAPAAVALLPAGSLDQSAGPERLGSAPIVSAHVRWDRPVLPEPFTAAVGTSISWVFARSENPSGEPPLAEGRRPQYLTVPISAAQAWIDLPSSVLLDRVVADLRRLLPAVEQARVLDAFVTRERHATFAQGPGTAVLRPPARTRWPALVLAGAWTATGWPDTLEGAVRSGETAAATLRAAHTHSAGGVGASRSGLHAPGSHHPDR